MNPRRLRTFSVSIASAALASIALSGCAPEPEPTPTPTALFSSDEEAFAAAEATYRAYVDATNAANAGDNPVPGPSDFLIGDALESHIDTSNRVADKGTRTVGLISVEDLRLVSTDNATSVIIDLCADVSGTRIVDDSGEDQTPPDRPERLRLEVSMLTVAGDLLIAQSEAIEEC